MKYMGKTKEKQTTNNSFNPEICLCLSKDRHVPIQWILSHLFYLTNESSTGYIQIQGFKWRTCLSIVLCKLPSFSSTTLQFRCG